ncbi:CHRD domain-containing protein [Ornithinimicrobium cerasi]|uniref:CHRD domain-containing protein n=1 Tax=Ornithinimicrobium cerasi TaxID=2248773 RepID=A0A285VQA1_9MICO|nr:CHRD domain-containing protein [Ornithinimicrobium cerasi]SOC56077.1 CHRD domain-containing protein [Ornithinimicrobium cerasi]
MKLSRTFFALPAAGAAVLLMAGAPALAASTGSAMADLQPVPLNDAPGSGSAMFEVDGTMVDFTLAYQGLLADAPHAAHIHFGEDARNACPTAEDDADGDGFISTSDGAPSYGGIAVSLTTEGDTSPDSGLAIDRFGVGDDVSYSRAGIEVDQATADAIMAGRAVVVVHGVDHNSNGEYDEGDRGASDLDPSLPGEATDPALCGVVQASQMGGVPSGGVETGEAAMGGQNLLLAATGGAAIVGGALILARRRTATDN